MKGVEWWKQLPHLPSHRSNWLINRRVNKPKTSRFRTNHSVSFIRDRYRNIYRAPHFFPGCASVLDHTGIHDLDATKFKQNLYIIYQHKYIRQKLQDRLKNKATTKSYSIHSWFIALDLYSQHIDFFISDPVKVSA